MQKQSKAINQEDRLLRIGFLACVAVICWALFCWAADDEVDYMAARCPLCGGWTEADE